MSLANFRTRTRREEAAQEARLALAGAANAACGVTEAEDCAERGLWRAVLAQAIEDLFTIAAGQPHRVFYLNEQTIKRTVTWLTGQSKTTRDDFDFVCSAAGFHPETVRARLADIMERTPVMPGQFIDSLFGELGEYGVEAMPKCKGKGGKKR